MTDSEEKRTELTVPLVEVSQIVFLDAQRLCFFKHGTGLRLTIEGECSYLKVSILRAFPLSERCRFLSVRDGENKEIGVIVNPAELSAENRRLIEDELERRYMIPVVLRILRAKERFGTVDWTVETDRGARLFTTQNLRENAQWPATGRLIINDVGGNRYDIRDFDRLDAKSRELLLQHI